MTSDDLVEFVKNLLLTYLQGRLFGELSGSGVAEVVVWESGVEGGDQVEQSLPRNGVAQRRQIVGRLVVRGL